MPVANLVAYNQSGARATTGASAVYFADDTGRILVTPVGDQCSVKTRNGRFILQKHPSLNLYTGLCSGNRKIHVRLKKVVGQVEWWNHE